MSERTFRAVVAAVLVGALALAAVVAVVVLRTPSPPPAPEATATAQATRTASPTPEPTATPTLQPAFEEASVIPVGSVSRGGWSSPRLVLRFVESGADAIPDGAGSFTVTLADSAGAATISFVGTPEIDAPGSLGASAELTAPNVLRVAILAADRFNVEPITVTGLGIGASFEAALGPIRAVAGSFDGSLSGGIASATLPSPGTVDRSP